MHRSAAESLMWASRDDDPRCVVVSAGEAIEAGVEALKLAKNQRQRDLTNALLQAAHQIKDSGNDDLSAGVMDDTDD